MSPPNLATLVTEDLDNHCAALPGIKVSDLQLGLCAAPLGMKSKFKYAEWKIRLSNPVKIGEIKCERGGDMQGPNGGRYL
jgi:hypothetical protein